MKPFPYADLVHCEGSFSESPLNFRQLKTQTMKHADLRNNTAQLLFVLSSRTESKGKISGVPCFEHQICDHVDNATFLCELSVSFARFCRKRDGQFALTAHGSSALKKKRPSFLAAC